MEFIRNSSLMDKFFCNKAPKGTLAVQEKGIPGRLGCTRPFRAGLGPFNNPIIIHIICFDAEDLSSVYYTDPEPNVTKQT